MLNFLKLQVFAVALFITLAKKICLYQKYFEVLTSSGVKFSSWRDVILRFSQDHTFFPQFYVETSKTAPFLYLHVTFYIYFLLKNSFITNAYKCKVFSPIHTFLKLRCSNFMKWHKIKSESSFFAYRWLFWPKIHLRCLSFAWKFL